MKKLLLLIMLVLGCCVPAEAQTGSFPGPGGAKPSPSPSGFYGQSLFYHSAGPGSDFQPPLPGIPYRTFISVYNTNGILVRRLASNPAGQFYCYIKPGDYILLATPPTQHLPPRNLNEYAPPGSATGLPAAATVNITVNNNQLVPVAIVYSQVE